MALQIFSDNKAVVKNSITPISVFLNPLCYLFTTGLDRFRLQVFSMLVGYQEKDKYA